MVTVILITIYILCAEIDIFCIKRFSKVLYIQDEEKPAMLIMSLIPVINTVAAIGMLITIGFNFLLNYIKDDN